MYTSRSPFQGVENQVIEMLKVQEGLGLCVARKQQHLELLLLLSRFSHV